MLFLIHITQSDRGEGDFSSFFISLTITLVLARICLVLGNKTWSYQAVWPLSDASSTGDLPVR